MRALAILAGLAAAWLIPYARLGANVPLVALLVAAAIAAAGERSAATLVFGTLSVSLAAMAAWLDAGWIVAIDLVAACVLAAMAVGGIRVRAIAAPIHALADAPALVPRAPLASMQAIRGALLGTALVLPFGALFWTGDAAFAELGGRVIPSPSGLPLRVLVFSAVVAITLGLALAARRPRATDRAPELARRLSGLEWAIPLALLDVLFLSFVVVQLTVLFGGHDHVLKTSGLTYAEYAREGFWQLIAAATLTLAVVAATVRFAAVVRRADLVLRNVLLSTLVVTTLVVLASATHRLHLYEDAYGLTRSRLTAESFSMAVGGFLVFVLAAGCVRVVRRRFAEIAVGGAAIGLLAFSLSNPDGRVASRNVGRWGQTGRIDVAYLQGLSADAVPALTRLPDPLRSLVLEPYAARLARTEPWWSINLSRRRARGRLADMTEPQGRNS